MPSDLWDFSYLTRGPNHWTPKEVPKLLDIFKKQHHKLPWWLSGKESACQCRRHGLDPQSRKTPHAAEN